MPWKQVSLSIGALLGNLVGFICWDFFKKKKYIWVPFLDPEVIKSLCLGAIGTLIKEQDSPELILDYGAQRARL